MKSTHIVQDIKRTLGKYASKIISIGLQKTKAKVFVDSFKKKMETSLKEDTESK